MSNKLKITIVSLFVIAIVSVSFYFFRNSQSKKVEIKTEKESMQAVVENNEPVRGTTSLDQTDQKRSDLEVSATEKSAEPVGGSVRRGGLNLDGSGKKSDLKITNKLVDFGFKQAAGRSIDTIIIHSTYDAVGGDPFSVSGVIVEYKSYGVSPHYLIGRDGTIYRLVEDKNIAYHAGVAKTPDGRTNVNEFSIGIELINTKTDKVTDAQYAALNDLIDQLKGEYKIKYVLGHNQIAPGRKDDPWNFDWKKLN